MCKQHGQAMSRVQSITKVPTIFQFVGVKCVLDTQDDDHLHLNHQKNPEKSTGTENCTQSENVGSISGCVYSKCD